MKKNPEIENAIIQSLKNGATISATCTSVGISRFCLFDWRKKDADFDMRVREATESRVEIVEDVVYQAAINGDVRAAIEWLEHKAGWRKEFNLKGKIEHEINNPKDDDVIRTAEEILKASH